MKSRCRSSNHGLDEILVKRLHLKASPLDLTAWRDMVERIMHPKHEVRIAVVGKYMKHRDAYKSVYEALDHAGIANRTRVLVVRVEAEQVEGRGAEALLGGVDGILVPGGFGMRGIEGKIEAIRFARTQKIPFFGICLGMQCAVVECARDVLGLENANSTEFDQTTDHPVIWLMEDQESVRERGGTMRLGSWPCDLAPGSLAHRRIARISIHERHRHRYEFNNAYRKQFQDQGLFATGISPDGTIVEIMERRDHPWFLAVQFHPEFKSKPTKAHPLFRDFVAAALRQRESSRIERGAITHADRRPRLSRRAAGSSSTYATVRSPRSGRSSGPTTVTRPMIGSHRRSGISRSTDGGDIRSPSPELDRRPGRRDRSRSGAARHSSALSDVDHGARRSSSPRVTDDRRGLRGFPRRRCPGRGNPPRGTLPLRARRLPRRPSGDGDPRSGLELVPGNSRRRRADGSS